MMIPKPCVLIAGRTLCNDSILAKQLSDHATLLKTSNPAAVVSILEKRAVDLLLLEVAASGQVDVSLIRQAKQIAPALSIIIIDSGNLAGAFEAGATDAFPKPYDRELLLERVQALLRRRPDV